ncbi:MAG TPA: hypothetical protein VGD50_04365, partial [Candidatus Baltobacteraceae bacterium]
MPPSPVSTNGNGTATANFGTTYQTIEGYGGSTAWLPQLTTAQANTLFGSGANQLGLSMLRVRIDPSSTTGGSNWNTELANAQEATADGARVIATAWTPPAAFKSNNSTVMGSLNTNEYAAYATYLNAFSSYMKNGGVNLYAISMQNEPDANVTYESCVWTGAQFDTWVANNASVLTTKLFMPETEGMNTSYSDPALNDPKALPYIGAVAGHLYGPQPFYYANAFNHGKEVWATEHTLNPSNNASVPSIGDALFMAQEIHNSMVTAEYSVYVWWWVADFNNNGQLINFGLINELTSPGYAPTLYGYALGQYSKFVRPGYKRVSITEHPSANLYVSAYEGGGTGVIVVVNYNGNSVTMPVSMSGMTP